MLGTSPCMTSREMPRFARPTLWALRPDAIGAAPGAGEDMLEALDLDSRTQGRAEQRELGAAEALAGPRRNADRAVVLLEEEAAARRRRDFGHIAFLAAQRGQAPDPLPQIAAAEPGSVEGEARLLARGDEALEPPGAEDAA